MVKFMICTDKYFILSMKNIPDNTGMLPLVNGVNGIIGEGPNTGRKGSGVSLGAI